MTWDCAVHYCQTMSEERRRGGVRLPDMLRADVTDFEDRMEGVNHHMGRARMSASVDNGVVDDLRPLWRVPNLHVGSATVLPTSSYSHLTLLVLAARLVERLTP